MIGVDWNLEGVEVVRIKEIRPRLENTRVILAECSDGNTYAVMIDYTGLISFYIRSVGGFLSFGDVRGSKELMRKILEKAGVEWKVRIDELTGAELWYAVS